MKIYGYQLNLMESSDFKAYVYFIDRNSKLDRIEVVVPAVWDQAERYIHALFGGGILECFSSAEEANEHYYETLHRVSYLEEVDNLKEKYRRLKHVDKEVYSPWIKREMEQKQLEKANELDKRIANNEKDEIFNTSINRRFQEDMENEHYDTLNEEYGI